MSKTHSSDRSERTLTVTTMVPDGGSVLDAEGDLEDALRALHDYRIDPSPEKLAEAAQRAESAGLLLEDLLAEAQ